VKVEASININRLPEDVFAYLSVRKNDPVWMASVVDSEWTDPTATLQVGRRGRMVMKFFGRRLEFVDEVTKYESGRQIAHRTVEGPFWLSTACLCGEEIGGCRTTVVAHAERMVGRWVDPLVAKLMHRGFKSDLARLKGILESQQVPLEERDSSSSGQEGPSLV
jgi:hypothetical protein